LISYRLTFWGVRKWNDCFSLPKKRIKDYEFSGYKATTPACPSLKMSTGQILNAHSRGVVLRLPSGQASPGSRATWWSDLTIWNLVLEILEFTPLGV